MVALILLHSVGSHSRRSCKSKTSVLCCVRESLFILFSAAHFPCRLQKLPRLPQLARVSLETFWAANLNFNESNFKVAPPSRACCRAFEFDQDLYYGGIYWTYRRASSRWRKRFPCARYRKSRRKDLIHSRRRQSALKLPALFRFIISNVCFASSTCDGTRVKTYNFASKFSSLKEWVFIQSYQLAEN